MISQRIFSAKLLNTYHNLIEHGERGLVTRLLTSSCQLKLSFCYTMTLAYQTYSYRELNRYRTDRQRGLLTAIVFCRKIDVAKQDIIILLFVFD